MELSEAGLIFKKAKESGLVMSRVPKDVKQLFTEIAENEFCDDYGLTFKWIFDQAMEYQKMKNIMFTDMIDKINYIAENTTPVEDYTSSEEKDDGNEKIIRLINGRIIKHTGGKKDE